MSIPTDLFANISQRNRFDILTAEDVQKVEDLSNNKPRKVLGYRTPLELFNKTKFEESVVAL